MKLKTDTTSSKDDIRNSYSTDVDNTRDDKLTDFGKSTLTDRYLLKDETFQKMFRRVANHYADDYDHANRIYKYISNLWFMPATPILSNGGTNRGLPISCFLNETSDSLEGITSLWLENIWLAAKGGGIGSYWGNLRSIGEQVRGNGKTSGVIPFMAVQDKMTLAISQGSLRRGSAAIYLPIDHPEIEEFIEIRKFNNGGDPNRKTPNVHHGIVISDEFMHAVRDDEDWGLKSPKTKKVISTVRARDLWIKLMVARMETGEPYLLFLDTINKYIPKHHKKLNLKIKTSNLCSEITLPTGLDHLGNHRTAVCCLSSLNLEKFDEWKENPTFIEDVLRFLDNVLSDFIKTAPDSIGNATYAAERERSIGLGVMGFHSYLQKNMISIESEEAQKFNIDIFKHIKSEADKVSKKLAKEKGACPDAAEVGVEERFSYKLAIAPTASISTIAGNSSPGIEPYAANSFTQRTLSGSFTVKNKFLKKLLKEKYNKDTKEIWKEITLSKGSVANLNFLTENEKNVFKTAYEIEQIKLIDLAADRTPFICQSQSLNLFFPPDVHKKELNCVHFLAWKKGIKSLYYCRSQSVMTAESEQKATTGFTQQLEMPLVKKGAPIASGQSCSLDDDECLACQ